MGTMNLRGYLKAIRKSWMLVLVLTIVGTAAATALTLRMTPKYASTVTFFVSTPTSSNQTALQADQFAQRRVNSYAGVMTSDRMANLIIKKAGVNLTPAQVIGEITTSVDVSTVLLTATATDESPQRSLAITTAISTEFNGLVNDLDNPGSTKATTVLNAISGPTLNPVPVSPKKTLNIGLGLFIGLALGIAVAIIRELTDVTVRSAATIVDLSQRPVLATLGRDHALSKAPGLVALSARSPRGEAFRQLRTNLQFIHVDAPLKVIVVSSSVAAEGKSLTAANLALVFAEAGQTALLVEADLRQPRAAVYLGLENTIGLTNVLAGQMTVDDVLQPWGYTGLTLLASGSIPPNPSELLGSEAMIQLMGQLRASFDVVVIDSPPLLPVTDAVVLSSVADGVLMVVRHGKTTRQQFSTAVESLRAVEARLIGTVINMVPAEDTPTGYGGYRDPEEPETAIKATSSTPATSAQKFIIQPENPLRE